MNMYENLNAVIYARVSTNDKDQNPEHQIDEIKHFCERENIRIVANGKFVDELSGKDVDRPSFQAMLGRIMAGTFNNERDPSNGSCRVDLVVAWTQSRISRDTKDFINIKKQIESMGARFVFVDNPIDTTTDDANMMLNLQAVFSEAERKRIAKNVKMGQRAAKNNGIWITRPKRIVLDTMVDRFPKGAVRTDDRASHKTLIVTESEVMEYARMGYTVRRASIEYGLPYTTFRSFLIESALFEKYSEVLNGNAKTE